MEVIIKLGVEVIIKLHSPYTAGGVPPPSLFGCPAQGIFAVVVLCAIRVDIVAVSATIVHGRSKFLLEFYLFCLSSTSLAD